MTLPRTTLAPRDWATLAALSVLWGGTFLFAKIAVGEIPPFTLVLVRVAIAAAVLLLVMRLSGIRFPAGRAWWDYAVLGLLSNAIPFSLIFLGQAHIPAGLASILNATTPIFAVLVLHVTTADEKATPLKLAGVALGFVGVAVLVGPQAFGGLAGAVWPELACLAAALCYGFSFRWGRRFQAVPPLAAAAGQLCASTVWMLPIALAAERPWALARPGAAAVASVVAMAVLSTALAYILYFQLLRRVGGTNTALVTLLVPVSAIVLGALVLGERLGPGQLAGFAIILSGLLLIDGRLLRRS